MEGRPVVTTLTDLVVETPLEAPKAPVALAGSYTVGRQQIRFLNDTPLRFQGIATIEAVASAAKSQQDAGVAFRVITLEPEPQPEKKRKTK